MANSQSKLRKNRSGKTAKQSKSGWGGKRAGAGAPLGNNNAVTHGMRCQMPPLPLNTPEHLSEATKLRVINIIALSLCVERAGKCGECDVTPYHWREWMRCDGIVMRNIDRLVRLSRKGLAR